MFHTEKLEIHPDFGLTLQQVFEIIKQNDPLGGEYDGHTLTPMTGPAILSSNPYATIWVESHPEYIEASNTYLHLNKSDKAIYLLREAYRALLQKPPPPPVSTTSLLTPWVWSKSEQALERFEHAMLHTTIPTLDTYLQEDDWILQLGSFCGDRCYKWICSTEKGIPYISKHLEYANWEELSANPAAIDLLLQYPEKILFPFVCSNTHPEAIAFIREHPSQISWPRLSQNPAEAAVDLLLENPQHISYYWLSLNTNPRALKYMWDKIASSITTSAEGLKLYHYSFQTEINWEGLSKNPCDEAVAILEAHPEKIHWNMFCRFASTQAQFALIRENWNVFTQWNWVHLCKNPSRLALQFLKEHPEKIQWNHLLRCHNVFETTAEYDYAGIRAARWELHEEYHAWAGHPLRVQQKATDWGLELFGVEEEDA